MSNQSISWSAALRDLKADRAARSAVREERLRTAANFHGMPSIPLSAWRGRSGRRYVVLVYDLDMPDLVAEHAAVVVAVERDAAEGRARLVAVRSCRGGDPGFIGWLAACAQLGAGELHAHRLAKGETERAAIAADLTGPYAANAPGGSR